MENQDKGKKFQEQVCTWFGTGFDLEKEIAIGKPATGHKFDIVNSEKKIAVECKCYKWTETGNVPGAKIAYLNEAAFYLSFLPEEWDKYIVLSKSIRRKEAKKEESLAEYYFRTYRHMLGKTRVAEFDPEKGELRFLRMDLEGDVTLEDF